jgi:hypothetical protein
VFNRDEPLTGGWMTGSVKDSCYLALKVPEETFCVAQGQRKVVLTMQATNPQTSIKLSAGTEMTATAEITNQRGEGKTGDNVATATTRVPAMDLWITIAGDPEGLTPGLLPNASIRYTIEFGNHGSELSCANKISFSADENVIVDSFDFSTLSLVNAEGLPVEFQNAGGQKIGLTTPVSQSSNNGTYVFDLGSAVCLP